MLFAAVRVRGKVNVNRKVQDTMKFLRLNRVNHCVLLPDTPQYQGMLKKSKDHITWGEISSKVLGNLLIKRGRLAGEVPITPKYIRERTDFEDIRALVKALIKGEIAYKDLPDIKPVFRLHPPRKGFEGIKRFYKEGGALGYRGEEIGNLITRML